MSADRPCGGVRGALPGLAVCVMPKYTRPQPNMARSVEELSDVEQLPALLAKQVEELSDVEGFFALLVKQAEELSDIEQLPTLWPSRPRIQLSARRGWLPWWNGW